MFPHNAPLKYMTTTKIGEKGQLTVPKEFRQDLGLETGAPVAVLRLGDGLILVPEQRRDTLSGTKRLYRCYCPRWPASPIGC